MPTEVDNALSNREAEGTATLGNRLYFIFSSHHLRANTSEQGTGVGWKESKVRYLECEIIKSACRPLPPCRTS